MTLALFGNLGTTEILVILVIAVLIFGKDLPQAASKAYLQLRKLRGAMDDLRRDTGIDRELRNIERTVREAEWEARRTGALPGAPRAAGTSEPALPRASPVLEPAKPAEPTPATPQPATDAGSDA